MNNNPKSDGEVKKKCPFSGEWCGDWCPLYSQLTQRMGGMMKKTNMCAFVATNAILSSMSIQGQQQQKRPTPQIHLPGNIGGN